MGNSEAVVSNVDCRMIITNYNFTRFEKIETRHDLNIAKVDPVESAKSNFSMDFTIKEANKFNPKIPWTKDDNIIRVMKLLRTDLTTWVDQPGFTVGGDKINQHFIFSNAKVGFNVNIAFENVNDLGKPIKQFKFENDKVTYQESEFKDVMDAVIITD